MLGEKTYRGVLGFVGVWVLVLVMSQATVRAQIEPGAPGSVEYTLLSNGQSWVETSDPIIDGSYVEDLLTDRDGQPDGRGLIGIVQSIGFDDDYGVDAAVVDFGRDYTTGIVFPELTAVQIVPEPTGMILVPGLLLWGAAARKRRR